MTPVTRCQRDGEQCSVHVRGVTALVEWQARVQPNRFHGDGGFPRINRDSLRQPNNCRANCGGAEQNRDDQKRQPRSKRNLGSATLRNFL